MSDATTPKTPPIPDSIEEVRGVFGSDAALRAAIDALTGSGFDRADLSLPSTDPEPAKATPEQGAANPTTDADARQQRTLHASMAGSVGALAAAGVTIATGGAAAAAAAAALAAGLGAGVLAEGAATASNAAEHAAHEREAAAGRLVLSVRITSPERRERAQRVLEGAGASGVAAVTRRTAAVESARWTG
jgi:hypothetical protein